MQNKLTKKELVGKLAEETAFTKKSIEELLHVMSKIYVESFKEGRTVDLLGLGTLEVRNRAERIGRNPQTNEQMTIPAKKTVGFKNGKSLKDVLNS